MRTPRFGAPPAQLPTPGAVAGILAAVSIAACLLPARRAARISPMEALNES